MPMVLFLIEDTAEGFEAIPMTVSRLNLVPFADALVLEAMFVEWLSPARYMRGLLSPFGDAQFRTLFRDCLRATVKSIKIRGH